MMVERPKEVRELLDDLNRATDKINTVAGKKQEAISEQDLKDLVQVLNHFNAHFDPALLEDRALVPEDTMRDNVKNALKAVTIFQTNQPDKNKIARNNVNQMIISLFNSLSTEIEQFNSHLKNLEKHKIGQKVEKTSKSKEY